MAGDYRGALKVAGSTLKGWLIDTTRPARRVHFNLIIDNEVRGTFAANRRRPSLVRAKKETVEDSHGFSIPIRRAWISGEEQNIRVEDTTGMAIELSLTARLGPAPNENFEDYVVSGQVVLGGRERMPLPRLEDHGDEDHDGQTRQNNRQLLKKIAALSDADLAALVAAIERDILADRIGRYERADDWHSASAFRRLFLGGPFEKLLLSFGHSALKARNHATAVRVLTAAAALFPQSFEANFQAGVAMSLQGEHDRALLFFRAANRLDQGDARAKHEMVGLFGKMLRNPMNPDQRAAMRAEHLELLSELIASENSGIRARYRVPFAAALYAAGRYDEAVASVEGILATAPHDIRALVMRAKLFVAQNAVEEGRAAYERVLELDRDNAAALLGLKGLSGLAMIPATVGPGPATERWICASESEGVSAEMKRVLEHASRADQGYVQVSTGDGKKLDFWRSEVLTGLRESGLIRDDTDMESLRRWRSAYGARQLESAARLVAVIYDASGNNSGSEHLARDVAAHHAREGVETVIVGLETEPGFRAMAGNGVRHTRIGGTPADVRRFLLENDVSLVHAISTAGPAVARAITCTNIAFVCSLPFGHGMPPLADAVSQGEEPYSRQELLSIFERAGTVYTNSRVAQKIFEAEFGVRCSIVASMPGA
jgi:tetratricopeptide (TPR) repeat protein